MSDKERPSFQSIFPLMTHSIKAAGGNTKASAHVCWAKTFSNHRADGRNTTPGEKRTTTFTPGFALSWKWCARKCLAFTINGTRTILFGKTDTAAHHQRNCWQCNKNSRATGKG